jgi:hypothetical protein
MLQPRNISAHRRIHRLRLNSDAPQHAACTNSGRRLFPSAAGGEQIAEHLLLMGEQEGYFGTTGTDETRMACEMDVQNNL